MKYYYEENGWIRQVSPGWERNQYGFDPNGIGDLEFQNAHWAFLRGDDSLFAEIKRLLKERLRWPDWMMKGIEHVFATTTLQFLISKRKYKKGKVKTQLFRTQTGMTRDPYIMFYCAAALKGDKDSIKDVKPPWYIWRPTFNWWRRYMITENKFWLRMWETAALLGISKKTPAFSMYLSAWKAYVADSSVVKRKIGEYVPMWNYCIRQLIHHPLRYLDETSIAAYRPKFGFVWQSDHRTKTNHDPIKDPDPDGMYLDLDTLVFVHLRNKALFQDKKVWDPFEPTIKEKVKRFFRPFKYGFHIKIGTFETTVHPKDQRKRHYFL